LSGTFVVNGSPTKTQMVDGAGGRSQLSQLTTAVIILIVLLFLTPPLQYMPATVLSTIVFLIGIELVDIRGMRTILRWRLDEFVVAGLTGFVVVAVGVKQAILLAIVLSVLDHLRRSYHPRDTLVVQKDGKLRPVLVADEPASTPGEDIEPGLVVYRFAADIYYANASRLSEEISGILTRPQGAPTWFGLDAAGIADIDFSGGETLRDLLKEMTAHGTRFAITHVDADVRTELDRYGISDAIGEDAYFDTIEDLLIAYRTRDPSS
jgi:SulP family sulfate permease